MEYNIGFKVPEISWRIYPSHHLSKQYICCEQQSSRRSCVAAMPQNVRSSCGHICWEMLRVVSIWFGNTWYLPHCISTICEVVSVTRDVQSRNMSRSNNINLQNRMASRLFEEKKIQHSKHNSSLSPKYYIFGQKVSYDLIWVVPTFIAPSPIPLKTDSSVKTNKQTHIFFIFLNILILFSIWIKVI